MSYPGDPNRATTVELCPDPRIAKFEAEVARLTALAAAQAEEIRQTRSLLRLAMQWWLHGHPPGTNTGNLVAWHFCRQLLGDDAPNGRHGAILDPTEQQIAWFFEKFGPIGDP